ncbi:MAG TPA: S53 family peptidase [Streptosporangiaceae bacterium]|nr:S53 family peptidase [Streptosporangiaceae bacterium]
MRDSIQPARLSRSWRARLFAVALLSAVLVAGCTGSSGTASSPAAATAGSAATPAGAVSCFPVSCYAPRQFRVAYGIQPLLDGGIDGLGETVTVLAPAQPFGTPRPSTPVPDSGPPPGAGATDIRQDLAAFDSEFRLPAARIQVVNSLAGAASPWQAADEEAQDVEIVHAVAPAATLRVVLLPASVLDSAATATAGMLAGLRLAVSGTDVASIDWSMGEHFFTKAQAAQMNSILAEADAHHVTVVASSGDNGAFSSGDNGAYSGTSFGGTPVEEVSLPASDPLVLAVGGTMLTADPSTGAYLSETAWNGQSGFSISGGASGGGFSHLYARPAYQDGVPGISAMRGVPDVAGDAYDQGGISIVTVSGGKTGIAPASGTGAAAPLWAGLMALADQYAHHDLGFVNTAIYRIGRSSSYHRAFYDVTTGSNILTMPYPGGTAGWQAGPGWDPATGWGSRNAQVLVPLLAA